MKRIQTVNQVHLRCYKCPQLARALQFQAFPLIKFWGECVFATSYLINRTSIRLIDLKTPYEALFGIKPSYDNIKVFRCLCHAHNHGRNHATFDVNATKCIFQGYVMDKKDGNYMIKKMKGSLCQGMYNSRRTNFHLTNMSNKN